MAKALGKPALLPLLLAIPAVLLLAVLAGIGHLHIPEGEIVEYGHFLPHTPLQLFFTSFLGFAVLASIIGAVRFWKNMDLITPFKGKSTGLVSSVVGFVKDFLTHSKFKDCDQSKSRFTSHLFTFYGFMGLLITTTLAVVYAYVIKYYPLPLFHWVKILGNLSTLFIVIGLVWIISDRINERGGNEKTTRYDWTFIGILFTTVLTGIATEFLRYANVPPVAYPVYFIHLVFVFALLIYLPYSHFAHLIYRSVAMIYARYSGREDKV
jgi:quinone-modifying oxidoreductase subunit QmoC